MIRVGRRIYNRDGTFTDPAFPGFTSILCLTKSSPYGDIGPYCLKDDQGRIMENIWQFSKVYEKVPKTREKYSRYNNRIIWDHPEETHFENDKLAQEYWAWRKKGMENPDHVRYPVGYRDRGACLFAIQEEPELEDQEDVPQNKRLGYIDARKQIYVPVFCDLVKTKEKFLELRQRLDDGENLLIIEVDGPHQESLEYYKETYGVPDDFIEQNTVVIDEFNISILLNDEKHPFGHGYCLAMALLGTDVQWNQ